jgi:hypothetical protein
LPHARNGSSQKWLLSQKNATSSSVDGIKQGFGIPAGNWRKSAAGKSPTVQEAVLEIFLAG